MPVRRTRLAAAVALGAVALAAPAGAATSPLTPTIWTVAGTGSACDTVPNCGDGGPATSAAIGFPEAVATGPDGTTYVADYGDSEVRAISLSGRVSVVAGDGVACQTAPTCGDGGPATLAQLAYPTGVAVDRHGNLFIADAGDDEIREVSVRGTITRLAGTGVDCGGTDACGDGGAAASAELTSPDGVAVDRSGNVYVADTGDNEIRRIATAGTISTVAGTGGRCLTSPSCGDGAAATAAELNFPESVAVDSHGDLFIADDGDNEVREVRGGTISRLAGNGSACAAAPACGDGGPAASAELNAPQGVAVSPGGGVFVADWGDNEVRVIRGGTITRLAGTGAACAAPGSCGEARSPGGAQLNGPHGVALDGFGDVLVADTGDDVVRLVSSGHGAAVGSARSLALLALGVAVTRSTVSTGLVVSGAARVSLWVARAGTAPVMVAHGTVSAGIGRLSWNRHFGRSSAPHGSYTVVVKAVSGRASLVSAPLSARL